MVALVAWLGYRLLQSVADGVDSYRTLDYLRGRITAGRILRALFRGRRSRAGRLQPAGLGRRRRLPAPPRARRRDRAGLRLRADRQLPRCPARAHPLRDRLPAHLRPPLARRPPSASAGGGQFLDGIVRPTAGDGGRSSTTTSNAAGDRRPSAEQARAFTDVLGLAAEKLRAGRRDRGLYVLSAQMSPVRSAQDRAPPTGRA
ncbi:MAG: hypothetical protein MZV64_34765 [Ignavibacteriales bacterium]|nr:hypothetical protein [Ignavibacteriales bacterium]